MKKLVYITLALLVLPFLVKGQNNTENYIKSTTYQEPYSDTELNGALDDHKIETVSYVDGLGRPKQNISMRAGGNRQDIVSTIQYDALGRQPKEYLTYPEPENQGNYVSNPLTKLDLYYDTEFPTELNRFSETRFEESPLNRPLEMGAPGTSWQVNSTSDNDHTIKFDYQTNLINEVKYFEVLFNNGDTDDPYLALHTSVNYGAEELYKNVTKDENWTPADSEYGTTTEFTNNLGQVVLKRISVFDAGKGPQDPNYHDTYYVYDDFGNLIYVLSPKASENILGTGNSIDQNVLNDLGYQYKYDSRNRLIEKKIPGKDWEYIVYNKLDQVVYTQDANLRDNDMWLFTKYDAFGRVILTGKRKSTSTRENIQSYVNGFNKPYEQRDANGTTVNGVTFYYTHTSAPPTDTNTDFEVLTVNYYDSYIDYSDVSLPTNVNGQAVSTNVKGLPTVSKVRTLGTSDWTTSLTAYDTKGRAIYSDSKNNFLSSRDIIKSTLDFVGKATETESQHFKTGNATIITRDYFYYDHMGRLLSQKQRIDTSPIQLIAENHYDDLGQLEIKDVGGETFVDGYTDLQNVDITFDGTITNTTPSGSSSSWLAKAKTKGEIPASYDGGVQCIIPLNTANVRFGLLNTSTLNNAYEYFDYGIFATDSGEIKYVVNGMVNTLIGATYNAGDAFKVERVDDDILFHHNNSLLHTEYNVADAYYVAKASFAGTTGSIEALTLFGSNIDKELQQVDYKYNIRGWLTDINNVDYIGLSAYTDLFHFRITYDQVQGTTGATPLYNGNISQTLWKSTNTSSLIRSYDYSYDDLNRITAATGYKGNVVSNFSANNHHNLSNVSYDLNGNILTLKRNGSNTDETGFGAWDDLTYGYSGNRLLNVEENSVSNSYKDEGFFDGNIEQTTNLDDYRYDANGNMLGDLNKGISTSISYNHLNLPEVITIGSGTITYTYDATGVKLKKVVQDGTNATVNTEYAGNFIYSDNESVGFMQLQFFNHPEGYVAPTVVNGERTSRSVEGFDSDTGETTYSDYQYVFQYKDHLGNVRVSYSDSDLNGSVNSSEIIEESNYYPFGLKQKGYNNTVTSNGNGLAQQWKFGGKEYNEELGLNWYDVTARNYDPALGRWMNLDPLAEKMRRHSPYNYAFDNPVYFMDYDGMAPTGCCGNWNPVKGIGDRIASKVNSKIKSLYKEGKKNFNKGLRIAVSPFSAAADRLSGKYGTGIPIYGNGTGSDSTRSDGLSSGNSVDTSELPSVAAAKGKGIVKGISATTKTAINADKATNAILDYDSSGSNDSSNGSIDTSNSSGEVATVENETTVTVRKITYIKEDTTYTGMYVANYPLVRTESKVISAHPSDTAKIKAKYERKLDSVKKKLNIID